MQRPARRSGRRHVHHRGRPPLARLARRAAGPLRRGAGAPRRGRRRPTRSSAGVSTRPPRRHSATATWSGSPATSQPPSARFEVASRSSSASASSAPAPSMAALESRILHRQGRLRGGGAIRRDRRGDGLRGRHLVAGALASHARTSPRRLGAGARRGGGREGGAGDRRADRPPRPPRRHAARSRPRLRAAGRPEESRACAEQALSLYESKANLVSAEWARAFLGAEVTPA